LDIELSKDYFIKESDVELAIKGKVGIATNY
jgi:hypothetical protein